MTAPVATGPYCQVALEQAPNPEGGTAAISSYACYPPFEEVTDNEKVTLLSQKQVASGYLGPMPDAGVAKYDPEFAMGKVWPRPSHLGWLLAMAFGSWTSTEGDGSLVLDPDDNPVPVGAYKHVFAFKYELEPQTSQVLLNTGDGRHRFVSGVAFNEVPFAWENGAMVCDPKGLAMVMKDVDVGGTEIPTEVTPIIDTLAPYRRGDLTLEWLTGSAFTREFDFAIKADVEDVWNTLVASLYPTACWYKEDYPMVSGTIEKATLTDDDWAALAASTQFAARIKVAHRSTIGEGAYQPALWVNIPGCQLTEISRNAIKAERRRAVKHTWQSRLDLATGSLVTATLVNTTPAYNVYGA